jgi:hypothetical protein
MIYNKMAILPWFVHQAKHVYTSKENMVWYIWYKNKSPKNQLERATNPKFPPQAHKCSLVERLYKDVCKLILGRDMTQHNGPFIHIVSQEMIPHLYVFGSGVKHWVFRCLWHWCYHKEVGSGCTPHNSWEQQLAAATYSASVVDWATLDCLREDHETNEDARNWQVPEVDFLSTRQPAKSASEKTWRERVEEDEYQRTRPGADCRYLKILLTACRCDVLGEAWKRAHRYTLNCMSGLVAVR